MKLVADQPGRAGAAIKFRGWAATVHPILRGSSAVLSATLSNAEKERSSRAKRREHGPPPERPASTGSKELLRHFLNQDAEPAGPGRGRGPRGAKRAMVCCSPGHLQSKERSSRAKRREHGPPPERPASTGSKELLRHFLNQDAEPAGPGRGRGPRGAKRAMVCCSPGHLQSLVQSLGVFGISMHIS